MSLKQHFELMAAYNQWMNTKVYKAASNLDGTALAEDRGAFFGSLLGTLNHIVVGDTIWLKRFATHPGSSNSLYEVTELPNPTSLDQIIFDDFRLCTKSACAQPYCVKNRLKVLIYTT